LRSAWRLTGATEGIAGLAVLSHLCCVARKSAPALDLPHIDLRQAPAPANSGNTIETASGSGLMIQPLLRQTESGWRLSMPKQLSDGSAIAATFEEELALAQRMAKHSPIAT
jgi:hypothetical protein